MLICCSHKKHKKHKKSSHAEDDDKNPMDDDSLRHGKIVL